MFERLDPRSHEDVAAAREEMATWFAGMDGEACCAPLTAVRLAPGAEDAFALLRAHGVLTAIVSITWEFAVEWFARSLCADHWVGTRLADDGRVHHFWPADKASWLRELMKQHGVPAERVAAVGDSRGDIELLHVAGRSIYVGAELPPELNGALHLPDGNILSLARSLLDP